MKKNRSEQKEEEKRCRMLSGLAVWTLGRKACLEIGLMGTDNDYGISLLDYNQWSEEEVGRIKLMAKKEENRTKDKKKTK